MHRPIDELHAEVAAARKAYREAYERLTRDRSEPCSPERNATVHDWIEAHKRKVEAINAYNRAAYALNPGGSRSILVLRLIERARAGNPAPTPPGQGFFGRAPRG